MALKIGPDIRRFHEILRRKIKSDIKKYIIHGEMIGRKGGDIVSIPLPQIQLPSFKYGKNGSGGAGQGDGEPGDLLGRPRQGDGSGNGAGSEGSEHILEVDITLDELATLLGEELELPNIEPKGKTKNIDSAGKRYTEVRPVGPESLRHFRRTFKKSLKRAIAEGKYIPGNPIVPIHEDKIYKSWEDVPKPEEQAVLISMLDVSGSVSDEMKEVVRLQAFWTNLWLKKFYKGLEEVFIIHDALARIVTEEEFYHTRESGGTKISSAYSKCDLVAGGKEIVKDRFYNYNEWNIYAIHYSDGDNWTEDNSNAIKVLKEELLPKVNLFGYVQVASRYNSGSFIDVIRENFGSEEKVCTSNVADKDAIPNSIKDIFGKGSKVKIA